MESSANLLECANCHHSNPPGNLRCEKCSSAISAISLPPTMGWSIAATGVPGVSIAVAPGTVLAGRYEILELLGEGGMGAVYKATDRELDRVVALKVIRPELAGHPSILQRFKQELILARQVTHRNVIRIFDLGVSGGLKFITMEFVEGRDLSSLVRDRRLKPEECIRIIRQVCRALEAAQAESVIHRDLKPQNIMVSASGRVWVMDFGLARSVESIGLTQTGAMMGTPAYMSPEQAQGQPLDARSDLFSLGIIFYEMLTGQVPFKTETVLGTLLKRTQGPPPAPVELDPAILPDISRVVLKCLAVNPADRYQTATDLLRDLDVLAGDTPSGVLSGIIPPPPVQTRGLSWKWLGAGLGVLIVLAIAAFFLRSTLFVTTPVKTTTVSVLVADLTNATGDPIFDGTLEPMLNFALEGAGFITSYNRGQARKLAAQLQHASDKLDESVARLIAVREGVGVVVSGSLNRSGGGYRVSVKAIDAVSGKTIAGTDADASSKEQVLSVVPRLTVPIRKALGDATPKLTRVSAAETFTAGSIEAAHQYAIAQELLFAGKMEEALRSFSRAVELDPNLGRAYSGMAVASLNLGQRQEAEKYFKMALAHIERMTDREKYRTRGGFYVTIGNQQRAIEEYSALVNQYPSDTAGHANLAVCYSNLRNMTKALEEARSASAIYPKHLTQRNNVALIASYASDFQTAEREARAVLELNQSYAKGYIALAFAQLGQGQSAQAAETYHKLETISAWGASNAASGLADLALYEGRIADAVALLEKGAAADLAANNPALAANKFAALAYGQVLRGQKGPAIAAAERALAASKETRIRFLASRVFVEAGQEAKAQALVTELGGSLEAEPQAYGKLIEGDADLKAGNARQAIKVISEANKLLDTWIGRFDLGRAYLEAGAFAEADSELDVCIKRRGEAMTLFLDEVPTYSFFPPVYYFQGRTREQLKSPGAAESYRMYLNIRGKTGEDALVADVRRRLK